MFTNVWCSEKNIDFSNILSLNYLDNSNSCINTHTQPFCKQPLTWTEYVMRLFGTGRGVAFFMLNY